MRKVAQTFALSSDKELFKQIANSAEIQISGNNPWDIQVHNDAFYKRVLADGSLGLGESYMLGWWDAKSLDQTIFQIVRADLEKNIKPSLSMSLAFIKAKLFNLQTKSGSMEVIEQHYQLGNDLFLNMLDESLAYSCGYWKDAKTLDQAQKAKFDLIARKLGFTKGMKVLDIGCGWGGFAKYISENYGVEVLAITLSENQADYAKKIVQHLPVEVKVLDYRDVKGQFDRVVEIGMFEHVGYKNYRSFMEIVHRLLKDDGMLMLHTIGSNTSSACIEPFLEKYIFKNAQLPSIAQIGTAIEGLFVMEDWHNFSVDYDKTLMEWFKKFDQNWPKLKSSYPESFYRMWKYYLLSLAGGFRARHIQLWQVVLSKQGVLGGYKTVR